MAALADLGVADPALWIVSELPLAAAPPPQALVVQIKAAGRLCVVEEHVSHGGLGAMLSAWILESGIGMRGFRHLHAHGYPSGRYGSQDFHRQESGLDADSIRNAVLALAA
jgi:transketolase